MSIVYNLTFICLVPFLLVRLFWRTRSDLRHRSRWREHFARNLPAAIPRGAVWIHAVSVGETIATIPIVSHLKATYPLLPIVLTTTTATGAETVRRTYDDSVSHVFFPYDLPWVVSRFLRRLQPRLLILMETELWPNLLRRCDEQAVPVLVANARLSEKSVKRYALAARFAKTMLSSIDRFAAQGEEHKRHLLRLGARADAVSVTGSLKFDIRLAPSILESGQALRRFLGVNRAVWMAGSTRDGEESLILDAHSALRQQHPDLLLVVAPRHPQRFDGVAELITKKGFTVARHSRHEACPAGIQVYLLDSMGELLNFYAASDVAFVGGSLRPNGGHNVLEPAALGVPIIVGPHTYNFADIVDLLQTAGGLVTVDNIGSLASQVDVWLRHVDARDTAGAAARRIVEENRGAADKVMVIIDEMLNGRAETARNGSSPAVDTEAKRELKH